LGQKIRLRQIFEANNEIVKNEALREYRVGSMAYQEARTESQEPRVKKQEPRVKKQEPRDKDVGCSMLGVGCWSSDKYEV